MICVARLAAALVTCAVALAGCGVDDPSPTASPSSVATDAPNADDALNPGASDDPSASASESTDIAGLPAGGSVDEEDATPDPDLGVQVFAMWRDWDVLDQVLDEVAASGSHWIRFDVGWCSLEEGGPGQIADWYLDRLDAVVEAAEERGLSMLVTLTCSPAWARSDGRMKALPDDPARYGRIAGYLADRYAGRIAAWEIWNEPDCLDLGCANGDPAKYVPLLKSAYTAIKAADPQATVISGGISGINLPWLKQMFEAGAGPYLDGVGMNPYLNPSSAPPDTPASPGYVDRYRLTNAQGAHDLLVKLGYPDLPLWFTEFGWSTGRSARARYDGVLPATQAAYLTQAVDLVKDRYPFVTHMFWFTARDRDDSSANENGFGLVRLDGTPKPSYAAFKAANRALGAVGAEK